MVASCFDVLLNLSGRALAAGVIENGLSCRKPRGLRLPVYRKDLFIWRSRTSAA